MTLKQAIKASNSQYTHLPCHDLEFTGSVQVFVHFSWRAMFYSLSDYRVSSAVSGPSFIMIPR